MGGSTGGAEAFATLIFLPESPVGDQNLADFTQDALLVYDGDDLDSLAIIKTEAQNPKWRDVSLLKTNLLTSKTELALWGDIQKYRVNLVLEDPVPIWKFILEGWEMREN